MRLHWPMVAGSWERGGGIDGDLRLRVAGGDCGLLDDHGELLRKGRGVGHGEIDAVGGFLAELEGGIFGDGGVAEGYGFARGAGDLNHGLRAAGDRPAGRDARGSALIGGGVRLQLDGGRGGRSCCGLRGLATGGERGEKYSGECEAALPGSDEHDGAPAGDCGGTRLPERVAPGRAPEQRNLPYS